MGRPSLTIREPRRSARVDASDDLTPEPSATVDGSPIAPPSDAELGAALRLDDGPHRIARCWYPVAGNRRRRAVERTPSYRRRAASMLCGISGSLLLLINVLGMGRSLRPSDIDGYVDFAGGRNLEYDEAIRRLEGIEGSRVGAHRFFEEATRVVHEGMAHLDPADVHRQGLDHDHLQVPVWENWLLFALTYVKPETYRNYEFCDYRRALERGVGRCGQQALALVDFLSKSGFETGFVRLGGHVIATARTGEGAWYMLDPDYGGVVPFGIEEAESAPARVLPHYWTASATRRRVDALFEPEKNSVLYGGPEARWGRAYFVERAAYALKWVVPLALLALVFCPASIRSRGESRGPGLRSALGGSARSPRSRAPRTPGP